MDTALVLYESWFGDTRKVAESIADGLRASGITTRCARVDQITPEDSDDVDLLVLGAPTHVHGLSTRATRAETLKWADDPQKELSLETEPTLTAMREWLDSARDAHRLFACFSTRADLAELLTGSAAHAISRKLRRKGWHESGPGESFIVPRVGSIEESELHRAQQWGRQLSSGSLAAAGTAMR